MNQVGANRDPPLHSGLEGCACHVHRMTFDSPSHLTGHDKCAAPILFGCHEARWIIDPDSLSWRISIQNGEPKISMVFQPSRFCGTKRTVRRPTNSQWSDCQKMDKITSITSGCTGIASGVMASRYENILPTKKGSCSPEQEPMGRPRDFGRQCDDRYRRPSSRVGSYRFLRQLNLNGILALNGIC